LTGVEGAEASRAGGRKIHGSDTRERETHPSSAALTPQSDALVPSEQRAVQRRSRSHLHAAGGQTAAARAQRGEGQPAAGLRQALAPGSGKHCGRAARAAMRETPPGVSAISPASSRLGLVGGANSSGEARAA